MKTNSTAFKEKLQGLGVTNQAIEAVWPSWWTEEAEGSISAHAELRFAVARRLGLSPKSVIGEEQPEFVWRHDAKFKGLSKYGGLEQSALTSFGIALGQHLVKGVERPLLNIERFPSAEEMRRAILANSPFVGLPDVCAACWGLGIPVVHMRVFPLSAKNMVAMAVRTALGFAILIAKDASFPAPTSYHVAHELGHIAHGHLDDSKAIVDLEETIETEERDVEETAADEYALQLLTGQKRPTLQLSANPQNGLELANAVVNAARERRIEPGTLALCYGHQTSDWKTSYAALNHIYDAKHAVWRFLNLTATRQLNWRAYQDDEAAYLKAILGAVEVA